MNYSTRMSEYYLAQDLFVGAKVDFNSHKFVLIDADEYAFRYMESHAPEVRFLIIQSKIYVCKVCNISIRVKFKYAFKTVTVVK